jgi:O-antigen biosynthesis protein WbqP
MGMPMFFKRLTDIILSLFLLLLLAPLMVALAIAIKLDSPGPALYQQKRIGRYGKYFTILKFRTMAVGTPEIATDIMSKLQHSITRVGFWLRKTSLDELPQLFNVFIGQMSIVGPRPALYNQTELSAQRNEQGILQFLPGITGWAQVNGRDDLPDAVKLQHDKWYCEHWSHCLDWKILGMTVAAVLNRRGAF